MDFRLSIRVEAGEETILGPGRAALLRLVREHHSLHKAAAEMNMAYSKAWRIIRHSEAVLGVPVLIRTRGGSEGGGSQLTPEAEALLDAYTAFCQAMQGQGEMLFETYFKPWLAPAATGGETDAEDSD